MIDLSKADDRFYDVIRCVVEELVTETGLSPDHIMLIGARARDILHSALGHTFIVRTTSDADIAIALENWDVYLEIERKYNRIGSSNGIRYEIAGISVDIMPFGQIEDPEGISFPQYRGENLIVFGYKDVFQYSLELEIPGSVSIRIPQPAGYVALKMRAWIDRSDFHAQDKDARDLALAAYWYQESEQVKARIFDTDEGWKIFESCEFDQNQAAVRIMRLDANEQLSIENREDLNWRWNEYSVDSLAVYFELPPNGPVWSEGARKSYAKQMWL